MQYTLISAGVFRPLKSSLLAVTAILTSALMVIAESAESGRLNVLLIVADDLNADSVGVFGSPVKDVTPAIDRLAGQGMRFERAHVAVAVCQPSRSAIMTARHPHLSGGEGFFNIRFADIPTMPEELKAVGYRIGIMGKVSHSTPKEKFPWDMVKNPKEHLGNGRSPEMFAKYTGIFIDEAREADQPFFLMVNMADPHRPFPGNDPEEWYQRTDKPAASPPRRVFTVEEVAVPGFLPDIPEVRREVAEYFTAVGRLDDNVAGVLAELSKRDLDSSTLVIFLSDNGMAFPFSKSNCYLQSTRTPLIIRWPGIVDPNSVNSDHFVSGIDLMPTVLEAAGVPLPPDINGRSLVPLLRGEHQEDRDRVFTQYFQTSGGNNYPMRAVQTATHLYIFNPWSDGDRVFSVEANSGRSMPAMREAAASNDEIAARVKMANHRVTAELYDLGSDPDAIHNRIDDPELAEVRVALHASLLEWMVATGDPAAAALESQSQGDANALLKQMVRDFPPRVRRADRGNNQSSGDEEE